MDPEHDHLDDLLTVTRPATPGAVGNGVRRRLHVERRAGVLTAAVLGLPLSLVALLLTAMTLGSRAEEQGTLDLLRYAATDWRLVQSDPTWFLTALLGTVFWPGVAGTALGLLLTASLAGIVVHATDDRRHARQRT